LQAADSNADDVKKRRTSGNTKTNDGKTSSGANRLSRPVDLSADTIESDVEPGDIAADHYEKIGSLGVLHLVEKADATDTRKFDETDDKKIDHASSGIAEVSSISPFDEEILSALINELESGSVLETDTVDVDLTKQKDDVDLRKEKDGLASDVVLSGCVEPVNDGSTDDQAGGTSLPPGEGRQLVADKKAGSTEGDVGDAILPRELVMGREVDEDGGMHVKGVVKHIVTSFEDFMSEICHSGDVFAPVEDVTETGVETTLVSESPKTGPDSGATASLNATEPQATVTEKKGAGPVSTSTSDWPDDNRCVTAMKVDDKDDEDGRELADDIAASISEFLIDASVSAGASSVPELHDEDGKSCADVRGILESSSVQPLHSERSETCDHGSLGQEATEVVDGQSLMPLAEGLELVSDDSTMSYNGSELAGFAGCEVQTEGGFSSIRAEAATGERWSCLSSGDHHDVAPVTGDEERLSKNVVEVRDDVDDKDALIPVSEDIVAVSDDEEQVSENVVEELDVDDKEAVIPASEDITVVSDDEEQISENVVVVRDDDDVDDKQAVIPASEDIVAVSDDEEQVSKDVVEVHDDVDDEALIPASEDVTVVSDDEEQVSENMVEELDVVDDKEAVIPESEDITAVSDAGEQVSENVVEEHDDVDDKEAVIPESEDITGVSDAGEQVSENVVEEHDDVDDKDALIPVSEDTAAVSDDEEQVSENVVEEHDDADDKEAVIPVSEDITGVSDAGEQVSENAVEEHDDVDNEALIPVSEDISSDDGDAEEDDFEIDLL